MTASHDDVMAWERFLRFWSFVYGESTEDQWIASQRANNGDFSWFFRSLHEQVDDFFDLRLNQELS